MLKAKDLWKSTMDGLSIREERWSSCWQEIERLYTSADRFYHSMTHIDMMSGSMQKFQDHQNPAALAFAIIFHDAIYDTTRKDNEERSAEFSVEKLKELGVDSETQSCCATLILCTKNHMPVAASESRALSELSEFLLDLDLLILGSDPETYDKYAAKIRKEYAWVPEKDYIAGRTIVLRSFAARQVIFFTEKIRRLYEAQARENLEREIRAMELSAG